MTELGTPLESFRHAVGALLSGTPPNGTRPADVAEWSETLSQLYAAHAAGGTAAVVRTWNALTAADRRLLGVVSGEGTSDAPWPRPVPFTTHEVPVFPVDVFPAWLRAYVEAEAEAKQVPIDLVAMLALAVLSTACARKVIVSPKPGRWEPVNLYVVAALPPASRKSATFSAMVAPIIAYEREAMAAGDAARDRAMIEHEILESRLQEAKRQAGRAKTDRERREAMDAADNLAEQLREHEIPEIPRLVTDNVTSEKLASMLVEQGGRMAVLSPEGEIFNMMAGRYSGDAAPNFDVYLKAHAADDLRVDRRSRKSEMVRFPALTIGLAIQPEVIRSFGDKRSMRGLGLLGRFLYALPVSTVGHRKIDPDPVPSDVMQSYHQHMTRLLTSIDRLLHCGDCGNCGDTKHLGNNINLDLIYISILSLSDAAKALLFEWESWLEPQLAEEGTLGWLADWAGKLTGAILRIAGLLHMADLASHNSHNPHNCRREISRDVLARAITIGTYLIPHALAAFSEMQANPATHAARRVLSWIVQHQLREFTKRDAWQGLRGSALFRQAADLDPVLELLTYQNYIRPIEMDERGGPGRKPSQRYEVHPYALRAVPASVVTAQPPVFSASYEPPPEQTDGYYEIEGY
jgi:replicative DNA helicase